MKFKTKCRRCGDPTRPESECPQCVDGYIILEGEPTNSPIDDMSDPWVAPDTVCGPVTLSGTMALSSNPPVRSGISGALDDVAAFHDACWIRERKPEDPAALIRRVSRHRLLREEYHETEDAMMDGDVTEVADGLADIIYIALGSALVFYGRERFAKVWAEVQRSNMAKIIDGSVVRRKDGKVLKPAGWTPPDIEGALK